MKRINYFSLSILGFCCWLILLLMQAYEMLPSEKISQIYAQIELFLHIFMLAISIKIFSSVIGNERKILFWLCLTNLGLFLNELSFYITIYFFENHHFNLSPINYVINMTFSFVWNISILIFLLHLIKDAFTLKKFIQIFSVLMLINFAVICLFFDSVPAVFNYLSWQNISQAISSLTELIIYNLSIFVLNLLCQKRSLIDSYWYHYSYFR
jgi:hypothetical protein